MKNPAPLKSTPWSRSIRFLAACGTATLMLAASSSRAQTVTTSITNRFDATNSATGWTYWYDLYQNSGYNTVILDWDGTKNNGGAAGSGSVLFKQEWPGHASGQYTDGKYYGQNQIWGTFAHSGGNQYDFSQSIDLTKYDSISFDIHAEGVGGPCPTNSNGDVCQLTVGLFTGFGGTGGVHGTTNVNIPISATNGWYHVVALINKADAPAPAVGWALNVYCYGAPNAILFTNTIPTYLWVDNIQVNRSKEQTPPPTLSKVITSPNPGLNLLSSSDAGGDLRYQRTNLKLVNTLGNGFSGQSNVTYGFSILDFPNGAIYRGYQAHIFLTTGPGNYNGMDYSETNVIWLNVSQNADGTGFAAFRYKINEPQANSNMFGAEFTGPVGTPWAGTIATLGASNVLGNWSMTFNQDTNVILRGPGGVSTNFTIRPEIAPQFVDPLNLVFGAQPNEQSTNNSLGNVGQGVILASAYATNEGTATSIANDNFLADNILDTVTWTSVSAGANNVQLFPNDPGQKLVKWTIPDAGYGLQTSTNVANPNSWSTLSGPEATGAPLIMYSASGFRSAIVPSSALGPNQDFFRLFTRRFVKLQVLLPGETAAPGTVSGKTGTPDAQTVGVPFSVTINAVDANWNLAVTGGDLIHITSSDTGATLPADAALVGGTVTVSVTLNTTGSATVTATDADDGTKTANTSAPVTVN